MGVELMEMMETTTPVDNHAEEEVLDAVDEVVEEEEEEEEEEPVAESVRVHVLLKGGSNIYVNIAQLIEDAYGAPRSKSPTASVEEGVGPATDPSAAVPSPPPKKKRRVLREEYDIEDPFIDDTEAAWEANAALSKDGFFVYSGPLVPEGKKVRIEKADGTPRRGKKASAPRPKSTPKADTSATKPKKPADKIVRKSKPEDSPLKDDGKQEDVEEQPASYLSVLYDPSYEDEPEVTETAMEDGYSILQEPVQQSKVLEPEIRVNGLGAGERLENGEDDTGDDEVPQELTKGQVELQQRWRGREQAGGEHGRQVPTQVEALAMEPSKERALADEPPDAKTDILPDQERVHPSSLAGSLDIIAGPPDPVSDDNTVSQDSPADTGPFYADISIIPNGEDGKMP